MLHACTVAVLSSPPTPALPLHPAWIPPQIRSCTKMSTASHGWLFIFLLHTSIQFEILKIHIFAFGRLQASERASDTPWIYVHYNARFCFRIVTPYTSFLAIQAYKVACTAIAPSSQHMTRASISLRVLGKSSFESAKLVESNGQWRRSITPTHLLRQHR